MATKKLIKAPQSKLYAAHHLATDIILMEDGLRMLEADIEGQKDNLRILLRSLPYQKIVTKDGRGYKLLPDPRTKIINEFGAKAWALENPAARMLVSTGAITKAFKNKEAAPFFTRVHGEKLMPLKPSRITRELGE